MAGVAGPIRPGVALGEDNRRARELYRYVDQSSLVFRNLTAEFPQSSFQASTPSLSSALKPFVQFAALQCNVQRAFISVIDKDQQFFLSEASRILDVSSDEQWENDEALLWVGCGVPREGKLCEMTLALPKSTSEEYPFYTVSDLTQHPKYGKLPFVTGEPHFRFYSGTPLTTQNGIRIGTLSVMDTKPRAELTLEQRNFIGNMAAQAMKYLEINRDALDGRRSNLMSNALNRFVQGKCTIAGTPLASNDHSPAPSQGNGRRHRSETVDSQGPTYHQRPPSSPTGRPGSSYLGSTTSGNETDSHARIPRLADDSDETRSHPWTLARAANLLREALEVGSTGGVAFVEVTNRNTIKPSSPGDIVQPLETDTSGTDDNSVPTTIYQYPTDTSFDGNEKSRISSVVSLGETVAQVPYAPVQASSTAETPMARSDQPVSTAKLGYLEPEFLQDLVQRYPRGKLWVFDADGSLMSSDDDQRTTRTNVEHPGKRPKRGQRKRLEAENLQRLFPGSRQLIFCPLFDASSAKWSSACFCWSSSDHRTYTSSRELGFVSSFTKTVVAECSRLDILVSDRMKADFIGSVSHELRSPLHGILASAEFLSDTELSDFQRSLVETIEACSTTLLDTINHVLDFSKINSFARTMKRPAHETSVTPGPTRQLPNNAPPLLRLYAYSDVAAIAEEVVEGLCVGRLYAKSSDLTDISPSNIESHRKDAPKSKLEAPIDVLLDIEAGDWRFVTQPGALRRVIMNLVGNSLKYTSRGYIRVRLRQQPVQSESDGKNDQTNVILTVSDTGKGISPEYLQSKLFVPFAQEDTLTPGTGLGLSIVRSITSMLGGTIDVHSVVGQGTTVVVSLPVIRPSMAGISDSSNPPSDSTISSVEKHVHPLHGLGRAKTVSIYAPEEDATTGRTPEWCGLFSSYVSQWFELNLIEWNHLKPSEVLIVEKRHLNGLLANFAARKHNQRHGIIVLCNNTTRRSEAEANTPHSAIQHVIEHVSKPCGPYKLARAFKTCLGRLEGKEPTESVIIETQLPTPGSTEIVGTDLSEHMQELELDSTGNDGRPVVVQTNETISVKETSRNAQMALNSPFFEGPTDSPNPGSEFPFPETSTPPEPRSRRMSLKRNISAGGLSTKAPSETPAVDISQVITATKDLTQAQSTNGTNTEDKSQPKPFDPHVLLVDDNSINLRLLQTFMTKRKYTSVDSAENGALAVQAVENASRPYDIIFMDISMPVMNGFEATRAIRELEASRHTQNPSMIIALTGLASGRDQSEGFASGVDIYMTKPVSFKEVSKFLDNWRINQDSIA